MHRFPEFQPIAQKIALGIIYDDDHCNDLYIFPGNDQSCYGCVIDFD